MHEYLSSGHNRCMTRNLTATVTAQHAGELRANRDRTDDDIQADYLRRISDHDLAADRAKATNSRRNWERRAAEDAVGSVINRYFEDSGSVRFGEYGQVGGVDGAIADLEGVTITVSVTDLVATATLTPPAAEDSELDSTETEPSKFARQTERAGDRLDALPPGSFTMTRPLIAAPPTDENEEN